MRSGRSFKRQATVLVLLGCAAVFAGSALAEGPAPEPAPPRTSGPKPEPPGSTRREPAKQTTTEPTSTTSRAQQQTARATSPPAPPPPAPTRSFSPQPAPVTPSPPASVRPAPQQSQTQKPKAVKKKVRPRPGKKALPRVAPAAASHSSSPDTMLLIGGVALVILVLGDTVFLGFSARFLREAR